MSYLSYYEAIDRLVIAGRAHCLPFLIYICMNCTVNMELTVSDKSVFPTRFGRVVFKGIYSYFKNISGYRRFLFEIICLDIRHNDGTFFLTAADEN